MSLILIIGAVVLIIAIFVIAMIVSTRQEAKEQQFPYVQKKYFFTKSEQEFFRILEQKIDHSKYSVFPKVRMGDFVEVDLPRGERMPYWNRIRSRHVDFLIWDISKSGVAAAIELDGNSHNGDRAKESDDFKDKVYEVMNLPLIRVRVGSNFEEEISRIFESLRN
jgi:hypothetical protein